MSTHAETLLGGLVVGGGVCWAVYQATSMFTTFSAVNVSREPLLVCAAGVLVWLHAKWRISVKPR